MARLESRLLPSPSHGLLSGMLCLLLLACGDPGADTPSTDAPLGSPSASPSPPSATGSTDANAPETNSAADPCPPGPSTAPPGPDIAGIRLGMSQAEAVALLSCHAPQGHLEYQARWFEKLQIYQSTIDKQVVSVQAGDSSACKFQSYQDMQRCGRGRRVWDFIAENITLATPGLAGQQFVTGVWRTQRYRPENMPTHDSLVTALARKYGEPQQQRHRNIPRLKDGRSDIAWALDPAGNPLEEGNPLLGQCAYNVRPRYTDGQVWSEACGLSINAMILRSKDNPDLVSEWSIGMMNQGSLFAYGEALQVELEAIEQQRRSREVEQAQGIDPSSL